MAKSCPSSIDDENGVDRRNFARYPAAASDIKVILNDRTIDAQLYDRSIGGIAVVTPLAVSARTGQEVEVEVEGDRQPAYVRGVREHSEGGFRLSLSWDQIGAPDEPDESVEAPLQTAHFFHHDCTSFVCALDTDVAQSEQLTITLWNGKSFVVAAKEIFTQTREQRQKELQSSISRTKLIGDVYDLPTSNSFQANVAVILDYEFNLQDQSGSIDSPH